MKNKHLQVDKDTELLKLIYKKVEEQVRINRRNASLLLCIKFVLYFSFSALSYAFLFWVENPVLFVFCFILYGFGSLLLAFNLSHDFAHNTIFKNKKINHLCFIALYTLVGAHAEAWKDRHIHSHHVAPNVEGYDPDVKISRIVRLTAESKRHWLHRYQHLYAPLAYTIYSLFWLFIKDFYMLFSKEDGSRLKKNLWYHLSFWLQKCIYLSYILVLPLVYSKQEYGHVLLGFFAMHLLVSFFLLFTFIMTHHVIGTSYPETDEKGQIQCSWLMNQVKSSNDMHPFSKTANFIFGGFNNHIAHHLFPHVQHVYYPQISKIIYTLLKERNIQPNHSSYWGGLVSHLKLLEIMSRK